VIENRRWVDVLTPASDCQHPDRLEATWDVSKDQPVIQVKSYENDSDLYDTVCWSLQVQLFDGTDLVLSEIIYLSIENEK